MWNQVGHGSGLTVSSSIKDNEPIVSSFACSLHSSFTPTRRRHSSRLLGAIFRASMRSARAELNCLKEKVDESKMKFVNLGSDPAARIRHNLISRGKNAIKNNHLPRNNPLHVKTNTNICPRRALKTNIGLPLAAHGNATVFCEQAREIFLVWAEVEMESLWNSWAGKKLPAEFFRIQGRRNFRRGEIKNFKQEKTEKTSGHTSGWSLVVWCCVPT